MPLAMLIAMCSVSTASIWLARKRFQMSVYNRSWSRVRNGETTCGVSSSDVGRIASWAS